LPQTRPYLSGPIASIQADIARFHSGDRKVNGKWLTAAEYVAWQTAKAQQIAAERAEQEKRRGEERAAEEKRIEEQKVAEREREERAKKADADLKQSLEQFQAVEQRATQSYHSAQKGALSGQIFVSTRGRDNFKLGAVKVSLFERSAIDALITALKKYADIKIQERGPAFDNAKTVYEQAQAAENAAFNAHLASRYGDSNYEALNAAYYQARDAANRAQIEYRSIRVETDFYYSGAFYFQYLLSPIQTAETDADGKFVIEVPQTGAFVIAAQAERLVWDNEEHYYWLQPVSLESQQQRVQNLSNNSLTSATDTSSLIHTRD
jgi:hypothetical protein